MNITWPASHAALLFWAQLLLAWVIALYYACPTESIWGRVRKESATERWRPNWRRIAILLVVPLWIDGRDFWRAIILAVIGSILAIGLTYARERGREDWRRFGAEFELGAAGAFALLSALVVGDRAMQTLLPIIGLPMSEARIAAVVLVAAIIAFLERGGTQVVRAILNKASTFPVEKQKVDEAEYNRGRLIGSIERLLLAGMAAVGGYAALGFMIAAKGLVRSKSFEDRDFAEYFLIGTLASTALALAAGGALRIIIEKLW